MSLVRESMHLIPRARRSASHAVRWLMSVVSCQFDSVDRERPMRRTGPLTRCLDPTLWSSPVDGIRQGTICDQSKVPTWVSANQVLYFGRNVQGLAARSLPCCCRVPPTTFDNRIPEHRASLCIYPVLPLSPCILYRARPPIGSLVLPTLAFFS